MNAEDNRAAFASVDFDHEFSEVNAIGKLLTAMLESDTDVCLDLHKPPENFTNTHGVLALGTLSVKGHNRIIGVVQNNDWFRIDFPSGFNQAGREVHGGVIFVPRHNVDDITGWQVPAEDYVKVDCGLTAVNRFFNQILAPLSKGSLIGAPYTPVSIGTITGPAYHFV